MTRSKKVFIVGIALILILVVALGCLSNKRPATATSAATTAGNTAAPSTAGKLTDYQKSTGLLIDVTMNGTVFMNCPPDKPDSANAEYTIHGGMCLNSTVQSGHGIPITWHPTKNGIAFTGSSHCIGPYGAGRDVTESVDGTVSTDRTNVIDFNYSYKFLDASPANSYGDLKMMGDNIPIAPNSLRAIGPGSSIVKWDYSGGLKCPRSYKWDYSNPSNSIMITFE
jgi:hypothetical protein